MPEEGSDAQNGFTFIAEVSDKEKSEDGEENQQRRTSTLTFSYTHKYVFVALGFLAIGVSYMLQSDPHSAIAPPTPPPSPIETLSCDTPACRIGEEIKSFMDSEVDPCHDFYQYACGGWIRQKSAQLREDTHSNAASITELHEMDKANIQIISRLIESLNGTYPVWSKNVDYKIKRFYDSCMATDGLVSIFNYLTSPDGPEIRTGIPGILEEDKVHEWAGILTDLSLQYGSIPYHLKFTHEAEQDNTEAKSTICAHFTRELMPEGVSKLFVVSHHLNDPLLDAAMHELIDKIFSTFRISVVFASPWMMDFESKLKISEAILGMQRIHGFTGNILNSTFVEGRYAHVLITDDFLQNLKQLATADMLKPYGTGVIPYFESANQDIFRGISKANAYYERILDLVLIPAGISQSPQFRLDYPDVLRFSRLGFTVAHEFAHSLPSYIDGITYESTLTGEQEQLTESIVTPWTKERYGKRRQCVVEQYNALKVPLPSGVDLNDRAPPRVNGYLTVNENMADIIGLQVAFQSFLDNAGAKFQPIPGLSEEFSKEQIFFIGAAQGQCQAYFEPGFELEYYMQQVDTGVHSPASIRVFGSLRNFDEFSKAFNCPLGSRYNPVHKCEFFNH